MKKLMKLLLIVVVGALVFSFGACAMSLTCISHIDRDGNGRCDNCGQEVKLSRVKSLEIKTQPNKLYYAFNEELDLSGGVLGVTYKDDTTEDVLFTDERVSVASPDMTSEGEKLVSVIFDGARANFMIEVGKQKFVVTFDLGYEGGDPIPSQRVTINEHATAPATPSRPEWSFTGWYTETDELFDFALTPITRNITLYAGWTQSFGVTYMANYAGGTDKTASTVGGKADWSIEPDTRDGYIFAGWSASSNGKTPYDFNTAVSGSLTLYAMWVPDSTATHTVTFSHNYGTEAVTEEKTVPVSYAVSRPADPTRANVTEKGHQSSGFVFGGWYSDAECKTPYDFSSEISGNITIYAKWTGTYIFEAEHVSLTDPATGEPLQGMGASGGSTGPNMVDPPPPGMEGINASNGYYVTYLYAEGLAIHFMITSDRDVDDAKLIFRITCENAPFAIDPILNDGKTANGTKYSQYMIKLNKDLVYYETIEITDTTGHASGRRPFSDHVLGVNLQIKKGQNVFSFITANNHGMGGTMSGTAPVIDCIKISTSANLTWIPMTSNEFGQ